MTNVTKNIKELMDNSASMNFPHQTWTNTRLVAIYKRWSHLH